MIRLFDVLKLLVTHTVGRTSFFHGGEWGRAFSDLAPLERYAIFVEIPPGPPFPPRPPFGKGGRKNGAYATQST